MESADEEVFPLEGFAPSLREVFGENLPERGKVLRVAVAALEGEDEHEKKVPAVVDRSEIFISDGTNSWAWRVPSLRELFRGDKQPPHFGDYPPDEYDSAFMMMDLHVVEVSVIFGDPRDAEVEEVFSLLRRRPDGKSTGFLHDYFWQAAALLLASRPLSQAEFEGIMRRLERSCRHFAQGSTSRNYARSLRQHFYGD